MIKMVGLMKRRADLTHEQFSQYWLVKHAPLALKLPGIRRYAQNLVIGGTPGYDGSPETWWDDTAALKAAIGSPIMAECNKDEQLFTSEIGGLVVVERPILEGQPDERKAIIKRMAFLKRKEGLTREQFSEHWLTKHAPLALKLPGLRRYVQSVALGSKSDYDGVAETWWDDVESMDKAFQSPIIPEIRADEKEFLGSVMSVAYVQRWILP